MVNSLAEECDRWPLHKADVSDGIRIAQHCERPQDIVRVQSDESSELKVNEQRANKPLSKRSYALEDDVARM